MWLSWAWEHYLAIWISATECCQIVDAWAFAKVYRYVNIARVSVTTKPHGTWCKGSTGGHLRITQNMLCEKKLKENYSNITRFNALKVEIWCELSCDFFIAHKMNIWRWYLRGSEKVPESITWIGRESERIHELVRSERTVYSARNRGQETMAY